MSDPTYTIKRLFFDEKYAKQTIDSGLTLEEAKAHCNHPESSSSTATHPDKIELTRQQGMWFDGYYEEQE